ncbi:MAG TPA: SPOR domain-containing protein [Bryobacteraceae bacterium]|nr:SPOR domain-containing protein [Bryobacteraceae bacterium]
MSDTALGTQTDLAPGFPVRPEPSGHKLRKAVSIAFAGAVAFGLALSGLYLGNRIHSAAGGNVEATPQPGSVSQATAAPIPPPSAPAAQPVQVVQPPAPAAADIQSVQPELYLEVAALGPAQDAKYLSRLQTRGFDARVDTSGVDQGRILIGPYATNTDLGRAKRKLAAAGILALEVTE